MNCFEGGENVAKEKAAKKDAAVYQNNTRRDTNCSSCGTAANSVGTQRTGLVGFSEHCNLPEILAVYVCWCLYR